MGVATNGPIHALLELEGDVVMGGDFSEPAANVVRWDGVRPFDIGDGLPAVVRSLVMSSDGALCAGLDVAGELEPWPDPVQCHRDGAWRSESGLRGTRATALTVLDDGQLVATGALAIDGGNAPAAIIGDGAWRPVSPPDTAGNADQPTVVGLGGGAVLAVTDQTVFWWNGAEEHVPIASDHGAGNGARRVLFAGESALLIGGDRLWPPGPEPYTEPLSVGIAIWDIDR